MISGGALLLLGGIGLSTWYFYSHHHVWTNDAYVDGYQISISSDLERGRIIQLFVDEGDAVKEGQLLCQLDESILLSKKWEVETRIALLRRTLDLQTILKEKARDIFQIAKQEFEKDIISFLDYDKIEKDYRASEMACKVAEANLENGIAQLGIIEEQLRHTHVFAPRKGVISKRWVVAGDVVQVGQPLFSLTDIDHIWVTAVLEETKIEHIKEGNLVKIHIDAYPQETFSGKVFVVRASAASKFSLIPPDNATGNFTKVVQRVPVKIWFDPKPDSLYLYPGMSVEVSIQVR